MSLISGKLCTDRQSVYRELNNSDEIEAIHTPPDKELVRQYGEMGFLGINTGKQYRKAIQESNTGKQYGALTFSRP